nr:general transcription factor 3C polypeptide 1-like [Podarcis muralis]
MRKTPAQDSLWAQGPPDLENLPVGASCLPIAFTRLLGVQEEDCEAGHLLQSLERLSYSPADAAAALEVCRAIGEASHFGVATVDLARQFQHYEVAGGDRTWLLPQYLQDLIDLEHVLEVGGHTTRLVARRFASPWLLHSVRLKEDGPEVLQGKDSALPKDPAESGETELSRASPALSEEEPARKRQKTEEESLDGEAAAQGTQSMPGEGASSPAALNASPGGARTPEMQEGTAALEPGSIRGCRMDAVGKGSGKEASGLSSQEAEDCGGHTREPRKDPASQPEAAPGDSSGCSAGKVWQAEYESAGGSISFVGRPWRIVDGSLNKPVCKGIMEGVLCHIMTKPGITEAALCHHYLGVLQPVALLEILQGLESLGCIRKFHLKQQRPASLFSKPTLEEVVGSPKLSSTPAVFYEPTVDCTLKMGRVFPYELNWNKWVQMAPL